MTAAGAESVARLSERIGRLGRGQMAAALTAVAVVVSALCGVATLVAWDATAKEWQVLLGLCILVPLLVVPPIGWSIAALAIEAQQALRAAERLATTDPLTGTSNRRHLLELAGREFQRSGRVAEPMALLLFDIDRFKAINDGHGHAAGDEVLRRVAQAGQGCLREYDTLARLGGEEFVVLMPTTPVSEALAMAERLRQAVAALSITAVEGGVAIRPTVSVGVATAVVGDGGVDQVLARADRAMYAAKQAGRDRVLLASAGD